MIKYFLIIFFIFSISNAQESKDFVLKKIVSYSTKWDGLGLRVFVKKMATLKPTEKEWEKVRQILHRNPSAGIDLIYKWDMLGKKIYKISGKEKNIMQTIEDADQLMLSEKFEAAFAQYQRVAKVLKKEILNKKRENRLLYYNTVHNMGRALYGAGRFKDALEVYDWITEDYPRVRQVIFEKMWTAFRLGRLDLAAGLIASQNSSYFSSFLEPESYLVQIYIYKRLCREEELQGARKQIEDYKKYLNSEKSQKLYLEWAKSDIETYSLYKLAEDDVEVEGESRDIVQQKKSEQTKLKQILLQKFESEKKRILTQLEKVLAYSYLAIGSNALKTQRTDVKSRDELIKNGDEFWPVDDLEDWVDEIGGHVYIGDSKCAK